jgi:hypothetical protein
MAVPFPFWLCDSRIRIGADAVNIRSSYQDSRSTYASGFASVQTSRDDLAAEGCRLGASPHAQASRLVDEPRIIEEDVTQAIDQVSILVHRVERRIFVNDRPFEFFESQRLNLNCCTRMWLSPQSRMIVRSGFFSSTLPTTKDVGVSAFEISA